MKTASTPSTKITDEQISKLFDQIRPGIHRAGITGNKFQKMIQQEKSLKIRSRMVTLLLAIADEVMDSSMISVDYDQVNAIARAIKAGGFDSKSFRGVDLSEIPLCGTGKATYEVLELPWDGSIYINNSFLKLDSWDLVLADPLTALRYASKLPSDRRERKMLATRFKVQGRVSFLTVCQFHGKRHLNLYPAPSRDYLGDGFSLIVVRKPA